MKAPAIQSSSSSGSPPEVTASFRRIGRVAFTGILSPGSMRISPWRRGTLPVRKEPKLGQVKGAWVRASMNVTPSAACRSKLGVCTSLSP